jgi:hypothetical protein
MAMRFKVFTAENVNIFGLQERNIPGDIALHDFYVRTQRNIPGDVALLDLYVRTQRNIPGDLALHDPYVRTST